MVTIKIFNVMRDRAKVPPKKNVNKQVNKR
jgi:hypothetical protein